MYSKPFCLKLKDDRRMFLRTLEHPIGLLAQQRHLVAVGHIAKRFQQAPDVVNIDQRLKGAGARAQLGNVLALDLLAAFAAQILQRVRHDFALQRVQQAQLDLVVVVVDEALGTEPDGAGMGR